MPIITGKQRIFTSGFDCKILSNILFKAYKLCHQIDKVVKNSTMIDRINKTSICSIVFLDIIDYSKKPDSEQIDVKNQFNNLINDSLKDIAQNDRIILDTGDGVVIAYMGSPEDALFVALSIRDGILKSNTHSPTPLFVRFGINLGPVRVVNDINGRPNIIGDGINVAQRIMSFAKPNQILASRSYYEVTSHLTQEISQMFDYFGVKQDKHVREHEVYSVRSPSDQKAAKKQPAIAKNNRQPGGYLARLSKVDWKYVAPSLLILVALIALVKLASAPIKPAVALAQPSVAAKAIPAATPLASSKPSNDGLMPNETVENLPLEAAKSANKNVLATKTQNSLQVATKVTTPGIGAGTEELLIQEKTPEEKLAEEELTKAKLAKKKAKQKAESETTPELVPAHTSIPKNQNTEVKPARQPAKAAESTAENDKTKEKSGWKTFTDSVKQGKEHQCTQLEISMNQCR